MKADAKVETEVMQVLNKMAQCYADKDIDSIMQLFAQDPDVVCIGTGADEKRIGPKQIRTQFERDFSQCDKISCEWGWHIVSAASDVAWVAADYSASAVVNGEQMALAMRTSAVLQKQDGKWLIVHMHGSAPLSAQQTGKSFPI